MKGGRAPASPRSQSSRVRKRPHPPQAVGAPLHHRWPRQGSHPHSSPHSGNGCSPPFFPSLWAFLNSIHCEAHFFREALSDYSRTSHSSLTLGIKKWKSQRWKGSDHCLNEPRGQRSDWLVLHRVRGLINESQKGSEWEAHAFPDRSKLSMSTWQGMKTIRCLHPPVRRGHTLALHSWGTPTHSSNPTQTSPLSGSPHLVLPKGKNHQIPRALQRGKTLAELHFPKRQASRGLTLQPGPTPSHTQPLPLSDSSPGFISSASGSADPGARSYGWRRQPAGKRAPDPFKYPSSGLTSLCPHSLPLARQLHLIEK